MLGSGTASTTRQTDNLTGFHLIALLHHILRLMTVKGLKTIRMLDANAVAITIIRTGSNHLTIKGSNNLIICLGLEVYAGMAARTTVWTDDTCKPMPSLPSFPSQARRYW